MFTLEDCLFSGSLDISLTVLINDCLVPFFIKRISAALPYTSKVKYKEKDNIYSAKPNHDWSSHANDALRYLATGLQREKINNNQNCQRD